MIALATNISLFFPTTEALILLIVSISPKYNGRFSCRNSKVVIHNFLLQWYLSNEKTSKANETPFFLDQRAFLFR